MSYTRLSGNVEYGPNTGIVPPQQVMCIRAPCNETLPGPLPMPEPPGPIRPEPRPMNPTPTVPVGYMSIGGGVYPKTWVIAGALGVGIAGYFLFVRGH